MNKQNIKKEKQKFKKRYSNLISGGSRTALIKDPGGWIFFSEQLAGKGHLFAGDKSRRARCCERFKPIKKRNKVTGSKHIILTGYQRKILTNKRHYIPFHFL